MSPDEKVKKVNKVNLDPEDQLANEVPEASTGSEALKDREVEKVLKALLEKLVQSVNKDELVDQV